MDVYYPENSAAPLPVIIDIHGGGWVYGTKEVNRIYCMLLAKRGYTVFNINYRLIPDCTLTEQMNDVSHALDYIGSHLGDYPCDSSRIYLVGDSAGGQLAAYACMINESDELCGLFSFDKFNLKVNALGLISPNLYLNPFDFKNVYVRRLLGKEYKDLPYVHYLHLEALLNKASIPPVFLATSVNDYMAVRQTVGAYEILQEHNIDSELLNWDKEELTHDFSVLEPELEESLITTDKMLEFLNRY